VADYIIRRRETYHFKRYVPTKLASIIGRTVWRETLKASTELDAKRAAQPLIASTNEEIRRARQEHHRHRHALSVLTPDERSIVQQAGGFKGLRHSTMETRTELVLADAAADMLAPIRRSSRAELLSESIDPDRLEIEAAAAEAHAKALRTQIARNRSILARQGLKPSEAILEADIPLLPGEVAPELPDIDLTALAERWIVQKHLVPQHADQYRYPVKLFTEWHGSLPLRSISKAHVRDWRDAVARLPRSTRASYRAARMREALVLADKDNAMRITPQTGAKHLSAIKTLFKFALSEGYLEHSPAEGITYPIPKAKFSAREDREGFTLDQRRHLFASLATEYTATEDDYWIPLVALFQAMRVEEICQLEQRDIRQEGSIWVIDVTDDGEGRKDKNRSSVRTIPLAHHLVDRGFLDHVARSSGPLVFSTLKPDQRNRLAGPYGKRFGRHLRKRAKITDRSLTFHSLRGTWKDAARDAGVPGEVQERIMGHTYGGNPTAAGYGSGHSLTVLAGWLEKVDPLGERT
jgi:integrase